MSRLIDEIKKYKDAFKIKAPQEVQDKMLAATKKLEDTSISKNALTVGSLAKEINLPNAIGNEVSLFKTLEENDFAVVSFYRGVWCAYCNFELKALQGINEELKQLGAKLIAVSPQSPDASLTTKEKNELEFEVLSDNENIIAKEYGLVFSLAEELRPIYLSFGIDIPATNKEDSYEIPMPATYVINKNKEIIFSFIDEDYTKRCEPQDILEAIRKNS
ncbi:AhpC/TSA family protein [Poseidonibacter lekithochrous]|uniref:peroxiredoxin-like family protein n=1 Tax=Poseidonibacter TaxID=2321187 RepID=UPI001C0A45A4|nr:MULTISPECIES: peroxiredoxin-like family protein [Poseidonibacter]MBU3014210.1 AhpC/TSA family protein [Poseidonibacter lekithochrous]MDO6827507.1 peroxiredoxin-like family protein [Poseidonibacter sp. 1_MG-2023]